MKICERFCNVHCSTSDCPNIQCDMADEKWGYGISDDIGLNRIECKDCHYNFKHCTCDDCYFQGGKDCPKYAGDYNATN